MTKFKIEFLPSKQVFEIDSENRPSGGTGEKGSLLDIALGLDIDIDHACGGVRACSTCHVIIRKGIETCSESTELEEDQLDKAPGLTMHSRLACQAVPSGKGDLVIVVPNWNRNLVKE